MGFSWKEWSKRRATTTAEERMRTGEGEGGDRIDRRGGGRESEGEGAYSGKEEGGIKQTSTSRIQNKW
jgi:hypothetical protein